MAREDWKKNQTRTGAGGSSRESSEKEVRGVDKAGIPEREGEQIRQPKYRSAGRRSGLLEGEGASGPARPQRTLGLVWTGKLEGERKSLAGGGQNRPDGA